MPNHSQYQLLDPLRPEEYEALKADIGRRGVLVPVELDEDGNVLDGHHRVAIARELGVEYPTLVRHFSTENAKREHILKINLLRRHMGIMGWSKAFQQLAEARGISDRIDSKGGRPTENAATIAALATELGVKPRTARYHLAVADALADHPDLAEKVDTHQMDVKPALKEARKREKAAQPVVVTLPPLDPHMDIRHCSLTDLALPGDSVDLFFTDPPYDEGSLRLWTELGKVAAQALKPGGLLIAYSGQTFLPTVLGLLKEHLTYIWLGACVFGGGHTTLWKYGINNCFKPILFFAKGDYHPAAGKQIDDLVRGRTEKEYHPWQQSLNEAQYYVDSLTQPGDLVCDPFIGAGTTAAACLASGRRFVGCDTDSEAIRATKERLNTIERD